MRIDAVIGANFGDEGKGATVDFLSTPKSLVVRFNGGGQAGHTVVTPDGRRHIFRHVGAGLFQKARTFLSSHFLVNPRAFLAERHELDSDCNGLVSVSPRARVVTPFDLMINQAVEDARGDGRHGSCGHGINETVTRCAHADHHRLTVAHLVNRDILNLFVLAIQHDYVPTRCQELGIPLPPYAQSDAIRAMFLDEAAAFLARVTVTELGDLSASHLVFEGAQGLGLDEVRGEFPYVTRSRTGLVNVMQILHETGLSEPIHAFYVTRSYLTRHGAGPLPHETPGHPFGWSGPETNVTNHFQGRLRYAPLDPVALRQRIELDLGVAPLAGFDVDPLLALTCLDQVPAEALGALREVGGHIPLGIESFGPTRAHVSRVVVYGPTPNLTQRIVREGTCRTTS